MGARLDAHDGSFEPFHSRSEPEWTAYVEGFEAAARQLERFEEAKVPATSETLRTTAKVLRRVGYVER